MRAAAPPGGITLLASEQPNVRRYVLHGLPALRDFVTALAGTLRGGEIIGLTGPLGAGKTELVRTFVAVCGGEAQEVVSPSFVLEAVYPVKGPRSVREVRHWDLYRLHGAEPPADLFEAAGDDERVTFVEWAELTPFLSDLQSLTVVLAFDDPLPSIATEGRDLRCDAEDVDDGVRTAALIVPDSDAATGRSRAIPIDLAVFDLAVFDSRISSVAGAD